MKPEERAFLLAVAALIYPEKPRDVVARGSESYKRCWRWLEKWTAKGWYEYGVSLDLGCLTSAGKSLAAKLADKH